MPSDTWQLVLGRDGTILAATGGAPASWAGVPLADADLPLDLQECARTAIRQALHAAGPFSTVVTVQSVDVTVCLIVVDALALHRTPAHLDAVLRSGLEVLQKQAKGYDVALDLEMDTGCPSVVSIDADKIAWAVSALVGNALRYVRHGSHAMPGGSIVVRVSYTAAPPEVRIEVQDDGPGIPVERVKALFGGGTAPFRPGLGLLMVRDVVAAHGGHVEVDSETDPYRSGTTVRLTLPVS